MKVICSRLSDLLEKRDQLINQRQQNDAIAQNENKKYWDAIQSVLAPAKQYIEQQLSKLNLIELDVDLDYTDYSRTVKCVITNENHKFDNTIALAWTMRIRVDINTGEVKKESNSWSGLKSCTPDQVEYLKQCVSAIEFINNLDWYKLLNQQYPNYDDYDLHLERVSPYKYDNDIVKEIARLLKKYQTSHAPLRPVDSVEGKEYQHPLYFVKDIDDTFVTFLEADGIKQFNTLDELYENAVAEDITYRIYRSMVDGFLLMPIVPVTKKEYRETRIGDRI